VLCDLPAGAARESATTALRLLREPAAPAAGAAAPAPAPAPPKRDVRGVQLNMDGLLGRKEQEDQYIRALLLVDGITCVRALALRRRRAPRAAAHPRRRRRRPRAGP